MTEEEKPRLRFPKKERLKSRKSIESLFKTGKWINAFPVLIVWQEASHEDGVAVKTGVSVSKRKVRKAVGRNRIKRLIREAYRLNKNELIATVEGSQIPGIDLMFIFSGTEKPRFVEVDQKITSLLKRLNKDLNKPE